MISEVRKEHEEKVNAAELFAEQSRLIKRVNVELGTGVYSNFVPNYKSLATVAQIFGDSVTVKDRVILESKLSAAMSMVVPLEPITPMKHVDNLVFKTFTKNFNDTYKENLHDEQQQVLMRYIFSFSDGGVSLNEFLNEEIARLREAITNSLSLDEVKEDSNMMENTKRVLEILDEYRTSPLDERSLKRFLKIQELVREIL